MLPVGLKVPPVRLKSEVTRMVPVPPNAPAERFTTGAENNPDTVSVPPVKFMFSSDTKSTKLKVPTLKVMVCKPGTLMLTFWPAVGTKPVLQLVATDQSPLVPIQQSSTTHPPDAPKVKAVGP